MGCDRDRPQTQPLAKAAWPVADKSTLRRLGTGAPRGPTLGFARSRGMVRDVGQHDPGQPLPTASRSARRGEDSR